jgi:hypothetical protein
VLCLKKSTRPVTGLRNRGPPKALNDTKIDLNDLGGQSCSFRTNLVSFRAFRGPYFPTSNWSDTVHQSSSSPRAISDPAKVRQGDNGILFPFLPAFFGACFEKLRVYRA